MSAPKTLGEMQRAFVPMVAELIVYAYSAGYELTLGDAYRDPRVFGALGEAWGYGRAQSLHKQRLAVDLNLFRDGKYLPRTEDHRPLGMWWEARGIERGLPAAWGGHFQDGNHYSFAWQGRW